MLAFVLLKKRVRKVDVVLIGKQVESTNNNIHSSPYKKGTPFKKTGFLSNQHFIAAYWLADNLSNQHFVCRVLASGQWGKQSRVYTIMLRLLALLVNVFL